MNSAIALGIRPLQIPDQAAAYQKALTLKALMGQGDLQALQLQEAARTLRQNQAMDEAAQSATSTADYLTRLRRINPGAAIKLEGDITGTQRTKGELTKQQWELVGQLAGAVRNAAPQDQPAVYAQARQIGIANGLPDADKLPEQFTPELLPHLTALHYRAMSAKDSAESANYRALAGPAVPGMPMGAPPPAGAIPATMGPSVDPVSGAAVGRANLAQPEASPIAAALMKPQGPQTGTGWMGAGGVQPGAKVSAPVAPVIEATASKFLRDPYELRRDADAAEAQGTKQGEERARALRQEAKNIEDFNFKEREQAQPVAGAPGVIFDRNTGTFKIAENAKQIQEIADRNRAAGASKQITSVNAYAPASEEAQRDFMKSTRATYDQLKQAPVALESIEKAKALIPGARGFMGPGGESLLSAAKFMNNRLGFSIATEGVKNAEELRTRIFFNIIDNLKKMDAQPSQQQQLIMQESLGKLGTDPNALPNVLDAFADVLKGKIALHNEEVQSAIDRGVKFPYDPIVKMRRRATDSGQIPDWTDADEKRLQELERKRRGTQ